jgi:phage gpG-like protein
VIEIELDISRLDRVLGRLEDWPDKPAMAAIGELAVASSQVRIAQTKKGPDGKAWKPWRTKRFPKHARHSLLRDTGKMLEEIKLLGATDEEALVAAAVPYSGYQHEGTRTIDPRPFLGLGKADEPTVVAILEEKLEQTVREAAA